MKHDIILAGVGGQGILTIAYLLDHAAIARGLRFKQAEVHGMAQRGGAVYSHMRISDEPILSDLIPEGHADMILSVEPLEVQRYLDYLRPGGVVVSNDEPVKNIADYPDPAVVADALLALPRSILVDAAGIATAAKMSKAQNMVMVGAATPFLPFEWREFEPIVNRLFGAKGDHVVQANMAVLEAGWRVGAFAKALLDAGIPSAVTGAFLARVEPTTLEPAMAGDVAGILGGAKAKSFLASGGPRVAFDAALLKSLAH
jgi:indolepyruvate ferredoxin oxidoreductase beta subunit